MEMNDQIFQEKLKNLENAEGIIRGRKSNTDPKVKKAVDQIIHLAAWMHHMITSVHPYRDGNGRTARLAANLILERFGLVGISIKIEKENKNRYRQALSQIDNNEDYAPLSALIFEGLVERYQGVAVRYHKAKN